MLLLLACQPVDTVDPPVPDVTFDVVSFNVESGGADIDVVTDEVVATLTGESLWGFQEVRDERDADTLMAAVNDPDTDQDFQSVYGTTGYQDHLVLAWDNARFELLASEELNDINVGGTARAPLVGHLRERSTGAEFLLVVNHLWRTDDDARHEQGTLLNAWGAAQTEPIVMIGDYNFDWDVETGDHDAGYDNLVADGVFVWSPPDPIVTTQCSSYDSVLDFTFLGGAAESWPASSEVLLATNAYCNYSDRDVRSDHRPVRTRLTIPGG